MNLKGSASRYRSRSIIKTADECNNFHSYWIDFERDFLTILGKETDISQSVFSFIRSRLLAFHLTGSYSDAYILNEVYLRAWIVIIHRGEKIKSSIPWIKSTAYNVIRELSRSEAKCYALDSDQLDKFLHVLTSDEASDEQRKRQLSLINSAFHQLEAKEQRLLRLKVFENKSWQEIRKIFEREEEHSFTESTLRKRKERILKKLRKIYESMARQFDN